MIKFFKESIKEFDHVVWPTNKETKNYFNGVTGLIITFTIFLFIVGTVFSAALFQSKNAINPAKLPTTTTKSTTASGKTQTPTLDLNNIKLNTTTGATK